MSNFTMCEDPETPMVDGKKQASREGLVSFTFWTEPDVRDDIKRLAIDSGRSVQELMTEAAKDLVAKHRKKSRGKG